MSEIIEKCVQDFKAGKRPKKVPLDFLGAFKMRYVASVRHYIDDEYAYDLLKDWLLNENAESKNALLYLAKFNMEYYGGFLSEDALHDSKELKKAVNDSRNSRRRDVLNVASTISIDDLDEPAKK